LDVLINNAGVYEPFALSQMDANAWLTGLHSTASSTFFATQAALPGLRASGQGRIINIGDSSADRASARELALGYHIGKTGVWMLTRSYAKAEASHGLTVNMVSPGYLENSIPAAELETIPAGRLGTFDDVWSAVRFLIDEKSSYITGTNIMVSGGWNLR
jgi:3-oxoacyl-[acyl-carrier protein] reductase